MPPKSEMIRAMKQQLTALLGVATMIAPLTSSTDTYTPIQRVTEVAHCTRYAGPTRREGPYEEIVTKNGRDYTHRYYKTRGTHVDACVIRSLRCWYPLDGDFNGAGVRVLYAPPVPARLRRLRRCNMAQLGIVRNDAEKLPQP